MRTFNFAGTFFALIPSLNPYNPELFWHQKSQKTCYTFTIKSYKNIEPTAKVNWSGFFYCNFIPYYSFKELAEQCSKVQLLQ
ncbi:MAG TPA: hypothetical protein DDW50_11370 [Firmicutes bacterium]|nr:hypothetical protein [Bacillota bacterium]